MLLGVAVLGLALVELITVLGALFGGLRAAKREPLSEADKLAVAHEVLLRFFGKRAPPELMRELMILRGLPVPAEPSPGEPSAAAEVTPAPEPVVVAAAVAVAASAALAGAAVAAAEATGTAPPVVAATAAVTSFVIEDDRELAPALDVSAASAGAHPLARSFLSFENIIFLLAACLVLGGTLYVVAVTWGRVPGGWQYLFLEGVILFYGLSLAGVGLLLDARLGLGSAARFLSATAGIVTAGAAVVALAAFGQHVPAGLIGSVGAAVAGTIAARILLRVDRRARWSAPLFGSALLLLAGAGWPIALGRETCASAMLAGAVAMVCVAWLRVVERPPVGLLAVAGAVPCAALLLPAADWLPLSAAMPALAVSAAITGGMGHLAGAIPLALATIAVQAAALGGGPRTFAGAAALVALALPAAGAAAVRTFASIEPAQRTAAEGRRVGAVWTAVLWSMLAALWARGLGLITPASDVVWAWTGVAALPFAFVCFVVASGAREAIVAELAGWVIIAAATGAAALAPIGAHGGLLAHVAAVAGAAGAAALAEGWALRRGERARPADRRLLAAHALALAAIWIAVRGWWPGAAPLAVATVALAMFAGAWLPAGRLAGAFAVPVAMLAVATPPVTAPRAWLAAVLGAYGLAHLLRPLSEALPHHPGGGRPGQSEPPRSEPRMVSTAFVGPPTLIVACGCALLYAPPGGEALLPWARWPLVLVAALIPLVAWLVWRGGPLFAGLEALAGLGIVALGGQALPALVLACALLYGRRPGVLAFAPGAVAVLAIAAMLQHAGPEPLAACVLLAGVAFVRRPLPPPLRWMRWLGPPALAAAMMLALFYVGAGTTGHLRLIWWPLTLAAVLAPFAVVVVSRDGPAFLRRELLAAAALAIGAALLDAFVHPAASRAAVLAAAGAAALLPIGLAAAHGEGGLARRVGWIAALVLAPLAVVPMTALVTRDPAAAVAGAAASGLGLASRRLRAADVGEAALLMGYAAALWALGVAAHHLSTGGSPLRILPAAGAVTAAYGIAVLADGRRLVRVGASFVRHTVTTLLALAAAFIGAGALFVGAPAGGAPAGSDIVMALGAMIVLGAFSLIVAFRYRLGWPFFIAETLVAAAFEYVRFRTTWLGDGGDWQAVAAAAIGFLNFAVERALRGSRDRLGVRESHILATLFPLLSALFVVSADPRAVVGMGLSAALFVLMAVLRAGALYGWLAALLANLALARVWITAGVISPFAYAAPPALALMVLTHVYRARLGKRAAVLRTLASLLLFASTGYEAFQFHSVWPAVGMAAGAVAIVLLGIHTRARAYLYIGFGALLLDIVVNLTRWGMRDRLTGGVLGVSAGMVMFAAGVVLARHRERVLARYRRARTWDW